VQAASNDTFVDLAIRYGTTADTLFALNDSLRAPLPPGRIVQLPDRYGPPSHVVKEGDTMYSIAGEYGVSVRALQDANDLENTSIQPGQKLRVPNRAPSFPDASRAPSPDTTGAVALYPAAFSGRLTASGTTYDPDSFVGSHPSLPYGSVVLLSHPGTRNHCFVEIIDRGPLEDDVLMDVSDAVARQLGVNPGARANLELRVIWVER
jgi:rare lipoprotein A (peptidoglycan hydrolase)